jgi:hypothetical protein
MAGIRDQCDHSIDDVRREPSESIDQSIKRPSRSWLRSRQAGEHDDRDYDGHDDGDDGEHVRCAQVPLRHNTGSPMSWCGRLPAVHNRLLLMTRGPSVPITPLKALGSAGAAHRIDDRAGVAVRTQVANAATPMCVLC